MSRLYAEIILPLPIAKSLTYGVPESLATTIAVGMRVIVPFGRKKYVTGIVRSLTPIAPQMDFEIKDIAWLPDDKPIVRHPQVKLWDWIADYYMCTTGEVMRAAIPAGLKVESETFVEINPDYRDELTDAAPLSEEESLIVATVEHEGRMTVDAINRRIGGTRVARIVSRLVDNGVLIISEKIVERYRSRREVMIRPTFDATTMREAFEKVGRAPKQQHILMVLLELSRKAKGDAVTRKHLLETAAATPNVLAEVVKKGLAEVSIREVNRFKWDGSERCDLPTLTSEQSRALQEIDTYWHDRSVVLLHGVTSSGKTEIYCHLIAEALAQGQHVLYLVPEIALTTQLTRRLQRVFGDRVLVSHSRFTDNERVDIWKRMLSDEAGPCVVLGARSSTLLPFGRLGLVIVDEEHDSSYKQADPAPRYNGRDVAIMLAGMHGAKVLLGSATPSIETYYKAVEGKFGLVSLKVRYSDAPLPPINLVDMTRARRRGEVIGSLSTAVVKDVNDVTSSGRQAIIFRNRRGYSPMVRCRQCAWVPRCRDCDVALTWHAHEHRLVCHYCGAAYTLPDLCPQCGQPSIEVVGYGTERVEEDLSNAFPAKTILRMDLDTTRNKDSYEKIIDDFSAHKADILVGTQMVTKGLDFRDVGSVVVVNADETINIPDFKSQERAFNMLTQVAGRAGRMTGGENRGPASVVVQTYKPDHPLFGYLIRHDYEGFYQHEIEERRDFGYPPFTRIIYIYLKHKDRDALNHFSMAYANKLRNLLGRRVAGPDMPAVARVKTLFIQKIMVKVEATASPARVREILHDVYTSMAADPLMRTAQVYYDVDP